MLLTKATYNKHICHKRETTTYHCRWSKRNIETTVKSSSECIGAVIEVLMIRTCKCIQFFWGGGWDGVMLCGVKMKSEQMSLESFVEDGECLS